MCNYYLDWKFMVVKKNHSTFFKKVITLLIKDS